VFSIQEIVIVYNPASGIRGRRRLLLNLRKCKKFLRRNNYKYNYIKTKHRGHAIDIIENLREVDLVITVGGDGTFNEAVTGNLKREKHLVLSHIPTGTTNDLGAIFCLGRNMLENLKLILNGEVCGIDICNINNKPFVYVAGFGRFLDIPYETSRKVKKRLGYMAYVLNGVKEFFIGKTHLYQITYELEGEKHTEKCSFALISNANKVAGIRNMYKDVKINDGQFEVLLCNLRKKSEIIRALFAIASSNITTANGFKFFRTDYLKINFEEHLKKPWCLDGEKFDCDVLEYEIRTNTTLKMLLPQKALKEGGIIEK